MAVGAGDLLGPRPGLAAVVTVGGKDRGGHVLATAGLEPAPGEVGPAVVGRVAVVVGDHELLVVEQLQRVQVTAQPAGHHHRPAPVQPAVPGAGDDQVPVACLGAVGVEGVVERGVQHRPGPDVEGAHRVAPGPPRVLDRHVAGVPGPAGVEAGVELVAAAPVVVGAGHHVPGVGRVHLDVGLVVGERVVAVQLGVETGRGGGALKLGGHEHRRLAARPRAVPWRHHRGHPHRRHTLGPRHPCRRPLGRLQGQQRQQ